MGFLFTNHSSNELKNNAKKHIFFFQRDKKTFFMKKSSKKFCYLKNYIYFCCGIKQQWLRFETFCPFHKTIFHPQI